MIASFGIIGLFVWLVMAILGLIAFVFWIMMLIHAIANKALEGTEKVVWVLVIIFLHFLGALIYFFVGRSKGMT